MSRNVTHVGYDLRKDAEGEKLAQKASEKKHSRMLNLFGVKAYYDMKLGTPLEEQSFPVLSGLEVDQKIQ